MDMFGKANLYNRLDHKKDQRRAAIAPWDITEYNCTLGKPSSLENFKKRWLLPLEKDYSNNFQT